MKSIYQIMYDTYTKPYHFEQKVETGDTPRTGQIRPFHVSAFTLLILIIEANMSFWYHVVCQLVIQHGSPKLTRASEK